MAIKNIFIVSQREDRQEAVTAAFSKYITSPTAKGVISVKIDTFYLDCITLPLDEAYSALPQYGLLKRGCSDNLKSSLAFLCSNLVCLM